MSSTALVIVRAHRSVPKSSTIKENGTGHADGVGDLYLATAWRPRSHNVLGHPPGRVGGGAVDLGRVLARERPPPWRAAPP